MLLSEAILMIMICAVPEVILRSVALAVTGDHVVVLVPVLALEAMWMTVVRAADRNHVEVNNYGAAGY